MRTYEAVRSRERFLAEIAPQPGFEQLFEYLPDVLLFVKDAEGRFVVCNKAFAALVGARDEEAVYGRRDPDFFPPDLVENYGRDDAIVLTTGRTLVDHIELIRNRDGGIDWFNTTKVPVLGRNGRIIGVAGMTRDLKKMKSTNERFMAM